MGTHHPIRKIVAPEPVAIPDKLYFRIGDVATLCAVPAYVLRFWETEFPQLKPNKGGTGQRLYRKKDVEMALRIKGLLYDQGYTIPGARQVFKTESKTKESGLPEAPEPVAISHDPGPRVISEAKPHRDARLEALRGELKSLLADLSAPAGAAPAELLSPKVKPMRPRLVLEKKPEPTAAKPAKTLLTLQQRDLFGSPDDDAPIPA
jgi:DNA-binding transcriptional MerR regulator